MRRLLLLLLFIAVHAAYGQGGEQDVVVLQKPLPKYGFKNNPYLRGWRYQQGDNAAYADAAYNDSGWERVNPRLDSNSGGRAYYRLNGMAWLRWHIVADSSILNVPLQLRLEHFGASEVYLDGKKIKSYGHIGGRDSTEEYNPKLMPILFTLTQTGEHVIAVRYAAFNAERNYAKYNEEMRGINVAINTASSFITSDHQRIVSLTFMLLFLVGIFMALALCHMFLFLYHRAARSNLFFSIFCLGLAGILLALWLSTAMPNPMLYLGRHYSIPVLISVVCLSLSGFVNYLFSKGKRRFVLIIILCVIAPPLYWKMNGIIPIGVVALVTLIEAMVLIVRAMLLRVRGARIIGIGVLLFAGFMAFNVAYLLVLRRDIYLEDGSAAQIIFATLALLSIISLPVSMSVFLAWNFASVNKELKKNLQQVKELSDKTIAQELERTRMIENQKEDLEREVAARTAEVVAQKEQLEQQHSELKTAKHKSDELLLNILPSEVAEELKEKGHTEARLFNNVSVLFTDFVGFTKAGERMSPQELVDELHVCFRTFDEIISKYRIEKIKTIGDAYLAVAGLPATDEQHALNVTRAALEIQAFMKERKSRLGDKTFEIRIGIHSGSVVAGIVGIKKFAYDIWGDTVNTAARMESSSEAGRVNVSEPTYMLIKERFECTYRGMIDAKNKGEMNMYFVEREKY